MHDPHYYTLWFIYWSQFQVAKKSNGICNIYHNCPFLSASSSVGWYQLENKIDPIRYSLLLYQETTWWETTTNNLNWGLCVDFQYCSRNNHLKYITRNSPEPPSVPEGKHKILGGTNWHLLPTPTTPIIGGEHLPITIWLLQQLHLLLLGIEKKEERE